VRTVVGQVGVHGAAEIACVNFCAGVEQDLGKSSGPAAYLKNTLTLELFRLPLGAGKKSFPGIRCLIEFIDLYLSITVPLLAEAGGISIVFDKARNKIPDGVPFFSTGDYQQARFDLAVFLLIDPTDL
jgi:hypothetical protein